MRNNLRVVDIPMSNIVGIGIGHLGRVSGLTVFADSGEDK